MSNAKCSIKEKSVNSTEKHELVLALKKHFKSDVMGVKGGGFAIRGKGMISLAKARQITGIKGKTRSKSTSHREYGDYATLRKIAGRM